MTKPQINKPNIGTQVLEEGIKEDINDKWVINYKSKLLF